eukprot:403359479
MFLTYVACTSPCGTCVGTSTNCTSCIYEYHYLNNTDNTCNVCPLSTYYDATSLQCQACPNSPGYCLNATAPLSCPDPANPILDLKALKCVNNCSADQFKITMPNHAWNNNADLTVCRDNIIYVNTESNRHTIIGTYEYPLKKLTKVFVEIFNYYDDYPGANITIMVAGSTLSRVPMNFKYEPIVIMDKNLFLSVYNSTLNFRAMLNVTDKLYTTMAANIESTMYRFFSTGLNYNFTQKLSSRKITDVQNSVMYDYPVTAIRGSLSIHRFDIQVDLTTVDVNQKFLNMDEADGKRLSVTSSQLRLQGIFSDVKNAISARISNNTFILSQTNYILTVRPSCIPNFDFTTTEFYVADNIFNNSSGVTVSYHLFFYKGFSNVTYSNNTLNNIVGKGYSHFAGQYVSCPNLLPNNTKINFLVTNNYWDMTTGRDDARIDLQVQETNPNITFSVKISNNTFWKLFSNNYFILVQNYNPSSYLEFSGNYFYQTRIEDIAITFQTETAIYLFDNYVNDLYNRLRHFLYLDGPGLAHFKNLTIVNAYTGLDYNAYALILADVKDGSGVLIFENCNFTNWDIQMHYGINVAVKVKSFRIINSTFNGVRMLPLWHIINIKEAQQLNITDVRFNNYTFQAPKSSNGFAINVINLEIQELNPVSVIKNVIVSNMSTNFFQLINAHSDQSNITGQLNFENLTVQNNTFDAEISLIQFSGFLLDNAFFDIQISDSKFVFNNFTLYGNLISLMQNMLRPLTIRNTQFSRNFGAMFDLSSGNIALTQYPTQLKVDNCTFIQNTPFSKALIVVNENCKSFIYNSYFLENYSTSRGSVIMADYQETQNFFENCTFINNSASVGGVFYTQFGSMIDCLNCTVRNNFGIKGGVVYTSNDGYIKFRKSQIIWNKSLYSSILVTLSSPTSYTEFSDSYIYSNRLLSLSDFVDFKTNTIAMNVPHLTYLAPDYLAYLLANTVSIQNSVQLGLIYALNSISSNLKFQNLIIDTQENILSSFEASIIGSNLTIQNTIVTDTQNLLELTSTTFNMSGFKIINVSCNFNTAAKDKYLLSALLRSNFFIDNLEIYNTSNPIAFMLSSYLTLTNSSIKNTQIKSTLYQPISLTDSTANFTNVTIKNITVESDSMIHLSFSYLNSSMLQMTSINQTFILASDSNLYFEKSWFERDTSKDPYDFTTIDLTSIEYIRSCMVVETSTLLVKSTNITNFFTTDNGGAIATTNCDSVNVVDSYFQGNQALMGGALYLYCDEDQICQYAISNTTFVQNVGITRGGAVHYNYYAPVLNMSTLNFTDNQAPYGQNISAYPFKLVVTNLDTIKQQVSGQTIINPINVEVRDYYDNVINIDNTTKIELQSWNILTTQIQGASTLTVNMGQASFSEVTLLSDPGRQDEYLKIVLQQYDNTLINLTVEIDFRDCLVGEALQKQKCIKCPIGKFSLEFNTSTCSNCPLNAQCPGGNIIDVDNGFWRAKFTSSQIHECLYSPACLGGTYWADGNNITWPTKCDAGYGGNLCHSCVHTDGFMYTRSNKHECLKCSSNQTLNILRLVGIGLCLILALSVLILLNLRRRGTNYLAVLTRMLTNYMQIISFAASFNLGWPESLKRLYDSISIVSQSADAAFSLDCFFDNAGVNGVSGGTPTFFIKALILLVLPVFALLIIFAFWGLFNLFRKLDKASFTRNTIVSIIVVIFLAHPTLTSNAFSMMNCYEIESGEQWLQADLEIKCWNDTHTRWFMIVGLPMLIVWVIGMPVFALLLMFFNREKLADEQFFSRYRMLYQGLKRKHFYWEIVNTFRKISIVSINVFLSLYPDYIKAIYAMLMLAIIFKMQEILQPYEIPVFNWIEQREQIASIVTFYAGLYFVKADVSEAFKYIIIIIVFFVNAWFLVLWSFVAVNTFKWKFTKKVAHILRKIICKKLKESDLKPVDQEALGLSGNTSVNTKGNSVIMAKQALDEAEFDDIDEKKKSQQLKKKRGDYTMDEGEKSYMQDQTTNPLKNNDKTSKGGQSVDNDSNIKGIEPVNGDDDSSKKKSNGKVIKKKTMKSTDSNNHKTLSSKEGIRGSIIVEQKTGKADTKKGDIMSSFSGSSDQQDKSQKVKTKDQQKMKEINDDISSDDQNIVSNNSSEKQQKNHKSKKATTISSQMDKSTMQKDAVGSGEYNNDGTEHKISDDTDQHDMMAVTANISAKKKKKGKKSKVKKGKKRAQQDMEDDSDEDLRYQKSQDRRTNNFNDSIDDINLQSTTQNLKMPYSNTLSKNQQDNSQALKVKASKLQGKIISGAIAGDMSSSEFSIEENRVYTIKKKNQAPANPAKQIKMNEQIIDSRSKKDASKKQQQQQQKKGKQINQDDISDSDDDENDQTKNLDESSNNIMSMSDDSRIFKKK